MPPKPLLPALAGCAVTRDPQIGLPKDADMTTFLGVSLYVFAACAALGMIPSSLLAARARKPGMVVVALLIAAYVIYVLVAAAAKLGR